MASKVKPIPEGYHTVTPYLTVDGAGRAIDFYKQAFGAELLVRMDGPDGKVGHAELQIGDSRIMLADEFPNMGGKSPQTLGGSPVAIMLYVEDVDTMYRQALAAGAKEDRPLQDQFYGDRMGSVMDPFGHKWFLGTHVEDVSPEEMKRRSAEMMASAGAPA
jgi:PhnB protein